MLACTRAFIVRNDTAGPSLLYTETRVKLSIQIETEGAAAEDFAAALLERLGRQDRNSSTQEAVPQDATPAEGHVDTPAKLKQGEKTHAIRAFMARFPDGLPPKLILQHLRENYEWAVQAKSLANTVHTTLNNLKDRGEVVALRTDKGHIYKIISAEKGA